MSPEAPYCNSFRSFSPEQLNSLLGALHRRNYAVFGPTIRDGAIVYDQILPLEDLPRGWTDEQQAGKYQLHKRSRETLFGLRGRPTLLEKVSISVRRLRLDRATRGRALPHRNARAGGCAIRVPRRACLRTPCAGNSGQSLSGRCLCRLRLSSPPGECLHYCRQLHASGRNVFLQFHGSRPASNVGLRHRLLADIATPLGEEIIAEIVSEPATREQIATAVAAVESAAGHMGRTVETSSLKDLLNRNVENPRWDALAERCLSCANRTMVCPTCFCSTIDDSTDLAGQHAERLRKWDCYRQGLLCTGSKAWIFRPARNYLSKLRKPCPPFRN